MKFISKSTLAVMLVAASGVAFGSDAVLSMSESSAKTNSKGLSSSVGSSRAGGSYTFDFLAGNSKAVIVQFDVNITAKADYKLDLSACNGGKIQGSDHRVFCKQLDGNRVRVLVDSPTNSEVPTSQIATISLQAGNIAIDKSSVVVGDITASAVDVEVL